MQINQNQKKNPDTSGLVKKTDYSAKISEAEGKIPSISDLATNSALTAIEIKNLMLVVWLRKYIITQKFVKVKRNLRIIIMTNMLLLQGLTC